VHGAIPERLKHIDFVKHNRLSAFNLSMLFNPYRDVKIHFLQMEMTMLDFQG